MVRSIMQVVWLHPDQAATDVEAASAVARQLIGRVQVLADEPVWRSEDSGLAVGLDQLGDLVMLEEDWVRERTGFGWSIGAGRQSFALQASLSIGYRHGAASSITVRLRHHEDDRVTFERLVGVYDDLAADTRADRGWLFHGRRDYQRQVFGQVDEMDRRIPGVGWSGWPGRAWAGG
ncbi:hypothetical protein [Salsipaludibacter albus]|uniref:hypothetical protein n=1 Tax=Salsipaludibacter albus TaxID=2849650 RepID=UPI001EE491B3|nr:hypothetical protein [Salsipaludibacter albus]MBY5162882.1 hypothetical protein [Salsipaludibacter albus]